GVGSFWGAGEGNATLRSTDVLTASRLVDSFPVFSLRDARNARVVVVESAWAITSSLDDARPGGETASDVNPVADAFLESERLGVGVDGAAEISRFSVCGCAPFWITGRSDNANGDEIVAGVAAVSFWLSIDH